MQRRDQRAADTDRKAIGERLRVAAEDGRLDVHEYDERLQKAFASKTFGELDDLVEDLPNVRRAEDSQVEKARSDELDTDDDDQSAEVRNVWVSFGAAALFFTGIWALGWITGGDGAPPYYWPVWILGIWGICAVIGTWNSWFGRR